MKPLLLVGLMVGMYSLMIKLCCAPGFASLNYEEMMTILTDG
jgi:hypothetical protein